jgi:hypothetical protein
MTNDDGGRIPPTHTTPHLVPPSNLVDLDQVRAGGTPGGQPPSAALAKMIQDLEKSGLSPGDMSCRVLASPERATTLIPHSTQGYVIPYFTPLGAPVGHYRVRTFDFEPKYKQPKDTPNYVYYPKGFQQALHKTKGIIVVTEGEKKASLACKLGIPCTAFGGVDSWRNRIITLPSDTALTQATKSKSVQAKITGDSVATEDYTSPLAVGMQDLIDLAIQDKRHIVIVYDTDHMNHTKPQVQRAAASLGYELRSRGIPFGFIHQLVLPSNPNDSSNKIGLDDYLMANGSEEFLQRVVTTLRSRGTFPRHPAPLDFINKRLQKPKLSRRETQNISMAVLSELDAIGLRLISSATQRLYYFDYSTHTLMKVVISKDQEDMSHSRFGQYLYSKFGLSAADDRLNMWISAMFSGEQPLDEVTPHRVIARADYLSDTVNYQCSDAQYFRVSADKSNLHHDFEGLSLYDNGEDGILFEAGSVQPLDYKKVMLHYVEQLNQARKVGAHINWWADALQSVRLKDQGKQRIMTSILFYLSPWLFRWRGTQLPFEMTLGEAGSGKSTLCSLRLNILTGNPRLRNVPKDSRDWYASITNTGGLHIIDNVQFADKQLRQQMSDGLCRLITEPNPSVEMRKFFTEAELIQIPVNSVFGVTSITQPFQNQDILQRSYILELDKGHSQLLNSDGPLFDSNWENQQIARMGGREAWIANHLVALHLFFKEIKTRWNYRYIAKSRLINFEQAAVIMASIFGIRETDQWIPRFLVDATERTLAEADWALEGLMMFSKQYQMNFKTNPTWSYIFPVSDIADWATTNEEYAKCEVLINARKCGRYIQTHKSQVAQMCGIVENKSINNRMTYQLEHRRGLGF